MPEIQQRLDTREEVSRAGTSESQQLGATDNQLILQQRNSSRTDDLPSLTLSDNGRNSALRATPREERHPYSRAIAPEFNESNLQQGLEAAARSGRPVVIITARPEQLVVGYNGENYFDVLRRNTGASNAVWIHIDPSRIANNPQAQEFIDRARLANSNEPSVAVFNVGRRRDGSAVQQTEALLYRNLPAGPCWIRDEIWRFGRTAKPVPELPEMISGRPQDKVTEKPLPKPDLPEMIPGNKPQSKVSEKPLPKPDLQEMIPGNKPQSKVSEKPLPKPDLQEMILGNKPQSKVSEKPLPKPDLQEMIPDNKPQSKVSEKPLPKPDLQEMIPGNKPQSNVSEKPLPKPDLQEMIPGNKPQSNVSEKPLPKPDLQEPAPVGKPQEKISERPSDFSARITDRLVANARRLLEQAAEHALSLPLEQHRIPQGQSELSWYRRGEIVNNSNGPITILANGTGGEVRPFVLMPGERTPNTSDADGYVPDYPPVLVNGRWQPPELPPNARVYKIPNGYSLDVQQRNDRPNPAPDGLLTTRAVVGTHRVSFTDHLGSDPTVVGIPGVLARFRAGTYRMTNVSEFSGNPETGIAPERPQTPSRAQQLRDIGII